MDDWHQDEHGKFLFKPHGGEHAHYVQVELILSQMVDAGDLRGQVGGRLSLVMAP